MSLGYTKRALMRATHSVNFRLPPAAAEMLKWNALCQDQLAPLLADTLLEFNSQSQSIHI